MEAEKLLSMMGLCKKAGKLSEGFDMVAEAAAKKKLKLIFVTCDVSERTYNNIKNTADRFKIDMIKLPIDMTQTQKRFGKKVGILGIADDGFAKAMKKIADAT